MPSLDGAVVPVTGANGGIGTHFVHDALGRGAAKVYATAHWSEEVRLHVRPDVRLGDVQQARVRRGGAHVFLARAFAPILAATQGSILIDVHSVASWYAFGGAYSASKAALWSATNSLRIELAPMGVHVMGVHMGYVDTDMAAHADGPKMLPTHLVDDGLRRGRGRRVRGLGRRVDPGGQGGSERPGRGALPVPARHERLNSSFGFDVIS
ncbi:SDR family NAD(P)-dependent oxidoreductase [Streptomyces bobili]|uniref:SDR family NAD(P)-dependent oxidoreductase n=1 Tax=Streptomyces bobili TaxID=67280 RepID=A0ABZ1R7M4_9ACTN|nr:SDR family NAD(P)-dependent oxidoreductase [Streptomyces bobili]